MAFSSLKPWGPVGPTRSGATVILGDAALTVRSLSKRARSRLLFQVRAPPPRRPGRADRHGAFGSQTAFPMKNLTPAVLPNRLRVEALNFTPP
jgi:hypothetical protein